MSRPLEVLAIALSLSLASLPLAAGHPGNRTYAKTCAYCHEQGVSGAPRIGSHEDWAPRIAQGASTLYRHAIGGYRGMPARGANPRLSDEEIRSAVDYMLAHVDRGAGGRVASPASRPPQPVTGRTRDPR